MKPTVTTLLASLLLCMATTSCKDSHDGPTLAIYQNIVTFMGNSSGAVNFEFQELDDSPTVRLSVAGSLNDDDVTPGTRLLMTYSLPDDATYGKDCADIILRGLQRIYGGTVVTLPHSEALRCNRPINLTTIYRTGNFINFTTTMPATDGRRYTLAADGETLPSGKIRLYLTTTESSATATYNTRQVGSIDISPVWNLPQTESVTVTVNNSQNPNSTEFTFNKK